MLIARSDSVLADFHANFLTKLHFLNSGNKIRLAALSVVPRGANFISQLFLYLIALKLLHVHAWCLNLTRIPVRENKNMLKQQLFLLSILRQAIT